MEREECKNYELEKDSNFCTNFIGDIFHTYHISKCYKYCSHSEAKVFIQNDEILKKVHSVLKQNIRKENCTK